MKTINYYLEDIEINDRPYTGIAFENEPYAGIRFILGKVEFKPSGDKVVMHYQYDIIDDVILNDEDLMKFRVRVGDLVLQLIEEGYASGTNVFCGGSE